MISDPAIMQLVRTPRFLKPGLFVSYNSGI